MYDIGLWMYDIRYRIYDIRYWMLDVGCWILDIGYWMLDIGCWMLDNGYWIWLPPSPPPPSFFKVLIPKELNGDPLGTFNMHQMMVGVLTWVRNDGRNFSTSFQNQRHEMVTVCLKTIQQMCFDSKTEDVRSRTFFDDNVTWLFT